MATLSADLTSEGSTNKLTTYKLTAKEEAWLESMAKHHSYFKLELMGDNRIKNAYFMDASNAPELSSTDKSTYNFERRVNDEGVTQNKLKKKEFNKFWKRYLTVALNGSDGIEYVRDKKFSKIYRCRPFGWVLTDILADDYGY